MTNQSKPFATQNERLTYVLALDAIFIDRTTSNKQLTAGFLIQAIGEQDKGRTAKVDGILNALCEKYRLPQNIFDPDTTTPEEFHRVITAKTVELFAKADASADIDTKLELHVV